MEFNVPSGFDMVAPEDQFAYVSAYADQEGDLVIKSNDGKDTVVCLMQDGSGICFNQIWEPETAAELFFEGDSITITF